MFYQCFYPKHVYSCKMKAQPCWQVSQYPIQPVCVFSFLFILLTDMLCIMPLNICENNCGKFLWWGLSFAKECVCVFPLLGWGKACFMVHCIVAWSRHNVIAPEWWSSIGSCHGNQAQSLQPLQVKVHGVMIQQKQCFSHYMYICYWIKYYGSNIS